MHLRPVYLIFIFVLLVGLACNFPAAITSDTPTQVSPVALAYLLVTPDSHAQPTPTPFQPLPPASTFPPPDSTTTGNTDPTAEIPTDSIQPSATTQPSATRVSQTAGTINILLLGSDARPNDYGFRTDVILWLSLNPKLGTATMISFPRDLWVYIPGLGNQRINVAFAYGFNVLQETFQYNFGITPDHYVLTTFAGFKSIIDTLGGIDVYASQNLTDACDLPQAVNKQCSAGPGLVHMNGATALWYARSRHSTSDFDRTRRAQEVIIAGFKRLMTLDAVSKAGALYNQFRSSVQTDLSLTDVLTLVPMASKLTDTSQVRRFAIGPNEVYSWVTPEGAMVLVPVQSACEAVISQAFSNP